MRQDYLMNWDAIGATGEVLGSIAVVITLVYLAVQIRQNTQSNRTAAIQTMAGQDSTWLSTIAQDSELADILARSWQDLSALSEVERARFVAIMSQLCRQYDSQLHLWRDGAIPDQLWGASDRTLTFCLSQPGSKSWWPAAKFLYSEEFQKLVDERLKET
jgi:hypothetical protein